MRKKAVNPIKWVVYLCSSAASISLFVMWIDSRSLFICHGLLVELHLVRTHVGPIKWKHHWHTEKEKETTLGCMCRASVQYAHIQSYICVPHFAIKCAWDSVRERNFDHSLLIKWNYFLSFNSLSIAVWIYTCFSHLIGATHLFWEVEQTLNENGNSTYIQNEHWTSREEFEKKNTKQSKTRAALTNNSIQYLRMSIAQREWTEN